MQSSRSHRLTKLGAHQTQLLTAIADAPYGPVRAGSVQV